MKKFLSEKLKELMKKGVKIINPLSVEIGEDVTTEKISGDGVVLYPGTRIRGAHTLICRGVKLGSEAPVTLIDCQVGPEVELNGGFFTSSVFLERVKMASGAHVREACILEEESTVGHTVGLKHTILFPFVTLGSLINFCDCLMAGGTSRKNHSEVGSSFIHFNYTPHQDKATPSLIGDVPRGVMLNQPPIFLGGQGGIVGPLRIGFGTVIAAGVICRTDYPEGGVMIKNAPFDVHNVSFHIGVYGNIVHKVVNNIHYIANLLALKEWYIHVRQLFFSRQEMGIPMYRGLLEKCDMAIRERVRRFREFNEKVKESVRMGVQIFDPRDSERVIPLQQEFINSWVYLEETFTAGSEKNVGEKHRDAFVGAIDRKVSTGDIDYIRVIQSLESEILTQGTAWLESIVRHVTETTMNYLPSFKKQSGKP